MAVLHRLTAWDTAGVVWLCDRRRDTLDTVMKGLTRAGNGSLWAVTAIGSSLASQKAFHDFMVFVAGFAIELSLYVLVKRTVSRIRPFLSVPGVTRLVLPPDEFSFPSGHTAAGFVMTVIAGFFWSVLAVPLLVLAMAIGISRVYLGVHFPSDVLAGALLGTLSGVLALVLVA